MSNRLPAKAALERMADSTRWSVLSAFARDIRTEIDGLKSGHIHVSGNTKAAEIANSRRRLARVYRTADEFGLYVEQPEKASA